MANETEVLHPADKKILEILQEKGRIPNVQLASEVGLSPSAVLERVRKLEERGIIQRYVAIVDNKKVGLGTVALVAVSLNLHQKDAIENFHTFIKKCRKVLECYHLAGVEDYILKVLSRDIYDYEDFLLNTLTKIVGVDKVKTMFVLSTLKKETAIPLEEVESAENGKGRNSTSKEDGGDSLPVGRRGSREK
ncbi:MAG: hypothetical protein B6D63_07110 [Candidatus Latescibacteria bacterium 4484_7]|nr:MAG: hypothetical protein B6D63_07110 [Candidatus Latescibacteria bacterium 4484_7]